METCARWIELVGVAGTGKSTLASALVARHPDWRIAESIHARAPSHLPYFVHSAPGLVRLLGHALRPPSLSWEEVKMYVYASEWHRYLDSQSENGSTVTLLDQGPLFALARLLWGGSAATRSAWFRTWKREAAARWAHELDGVVELSAPDTVLFERINERAKPHPAKGKSARETMEILASHRRALTEVLGNADDGASIRRLRFDTSKRSLDEIANELSGVLSPTASPTLDGMGPDEQRTTRARAKLPVSGSEGLGSSG
jgi:predicted kinase